ncbi:MAG: glycosyltransferase family 4 protein [Spirochaetes bacterium]|nr:glycosyltransferase family 4 protein [Spirochaetota bacterium]
MKLVIITNILNPYAKARFSYLANQKGIDLCVLIQSSNEPNRKWEYKEKEKLGFKCVLMPGIHINFGKKKLLSLHINLKVKNFILPENPDFVIIIGWNNPTTFLAARVCKKYNIPLIALSGSTINEPSIFRSLAKPIIRAYHKKCSAFFAYGTAAKELLNQYWKINNKKIHILGNPVDNDFFSKNCIQFRKQKKYFHPIFKKAKTILFVGQLIERKGILELLQAFKLIQIKFPDISLAIAGSGPLEEKIKNIIEKEQLNNIVLLGYVEYQKLPLLYADANLLCLPSREEVWGLVVNEAMACEVPVIASHVCGCVKDLIIDKKTGLIFNAGDIQQLALGLETYITDNRLTKKISKNGIIHIKKWDIKRYASGIISILKIIISKYRI